MKIEQLKFLAPSLAWLGAAALIVSVLFFAVEAAADEPKKSEPATKKAAEDPTPEDSTMTLKGGQEGTLFESLRVEGEDRVRIRFERPALTLALEPSSAPGLDWEGAHRVITRSGVDLVRPLIARSAGERVACYSRPWLATLTTGGVARFRPTVEGVDRWRLVVADSKGDVVASFEGKGKPPKEIVWDGRSLNGGYAAPGLIYSYVLEAYDKAGNKRNFVGEGFELPAYRVDGDDHRAMLFSGVELEQSSADYGTTTPTSTVLLEAASWLNQERKISAPVAITITARDFRQAKYLTEEISRQLQPLLLGDPIRIKTVTDVQPDAPERGTVAITVSS
jgi:hypothetical protein